MRKTILISSLFILTTILKGQESKISFAPTLNFITDYSYVIGGQYQNSKAGFTFAYDYLFASKKRFEVGLGINYNFSQVEINQWNNSGERVPLKDQINMFSFRVKTIYNLKKDFYLSLDPSLDYYLRTDKVHILSNQTGIGLVLGVGKNIKLNDALSLNIEPNLWMHNIIPFTDRLYPNRLTTLGLNLGLVFGHKTD